MPIDLFCHPELGNFSGVVPKQLFTMSNEILGHSFSKVP